MVFDTKNKLYTTNRVLDLPQYQTHAVSQDDESTGFIRNNYFVYRDENNLRIIWDQICQNKIENTEIG